MTISRAFLIIGTVYLLVGLGLGMHMGASGNHTLTPVHAHINLVGFVLMTLFGLAYRVMPDMAATTLGKAHFWLFQAGALVLSLSLYLLIGNVIPEEQIGPFMPVGEGLVVLAILAWLLNLLRSR